MLSTQSYLETTFPISSIKRKLPLSDQVGHWRLLIWDISHILQKKHDYKGAAPLNWALRNRRGLACLGCYFSPFRKHLREKCENQMLLMLKVKNFVSSSFFIDQAVHWHQIQSTLLSLSCIPWFRWIQYFQLSHNLSVCHGKRLVITIWDNKF